MEAIENQMERGKKNTLSGEKNTWKQNPPFVNKIRIHLRSGRNREKTKKRKPNPLVRRTSELLNHSLADCLF